MSTAMLLAPARPRPLPPIFGPAAPPPAASPRPAAPPAHFRGIRAAFGVALHMHQPLLPVRDVSGSAGLIGNLEHMLERSGGEERGKAMRYAECYNRIADLVRELCCAGFRPRIMLDYSGCLLWGLERMGRRATLDNLRDAAVDPATADCIEWLGTSWSHAVAGSTPPADFPLQLRAWRRHFAAIFGAAAAERVRGFSPPEMQLPVRPDVAYAYISALREAGYDWMLVQEDTIEFPDGSPVVDPFRPYRLAARDLHGHMASITVLVKAGPCSARVVASMTPAAQAAAAVRGEPNAAPLPISAVPASDNPLPFIVQVGDGENGPEMSQAFPDAFRRATAGADPASPALNGSEYLDLLAARGIRPADFTVVQPRGRAAIDRSLSGSGPAALSAAIAATESEQPGFLPEGGSWSPGRSWVRGYGEALGAVHALSSRFHAVLADRGDPLESDDPAVRSAALYLMLSQTSCLRYWGKGRWTDYAREFCRRGNAALDVVVAER